MMVPLWSSQGRQRRRDHEGCILVGRDVGDDAAACPGVCGPRPECGSLAEQHQSWIQRRRKPATRRQGSGSSRGSSVARIENGRRGVHPGRSVMCGRSDLGSRASRELGVCPSRSREVLDRGAGGATGSRSWRRGVVHAHHEPRLCSFEWAHIAIAERTPGSTRAQERAAATARRLSHACRRILTAEVAPCAARSAHDAGALGGRRPVVGVERRAGPCVSREPFQK